MHHFLFNKKLLKKKIELQVHAMFILKKNTINLILFNPL